MDNKRVDFKRLDSAKELPQFIRSVIRDVVLASTNCVISALSTHEHKPVSFCEEMKTVPLLIDSISDPEYGETLDSYLGSVIHASMIDYKMHNQKDFSDVQQKLTNERRRLGDLEAQLLTAESEYISRFQAITEQNKVLEELANSKATSAYVYALKKKLLDAETTIRNSAIATGVNKRVFLSREFDDAMFAQLKQLMQEHALEVRNIHTASLRICAAYVGHHSTQSRAALLTVALFCFSHVLEVEDNCNGTLVNINLTSFMYTTVYDNGEPKNVNALDIFFRLLYNAMHHEPRVVCFYPVRPIQHMPITDKDKADLHALMQKIHVNGKLFEYTKPYIANHPLFRATRKLIDLRRGYST